MGCLYVNERLEFCSQPPHPDILLILKAPPLPSFCVQEAPPFLYTAIDFDGPLYAHSKGTSRSEKVWICLFTCCVTRAIHLELVPDLTTTTYPMLKKVCSQKRFTKDDCLRQHKDL